MIYNECCAKYYKVAGKLSEFLISNQRYYKAMSIVLPHS